MVSHKQHPSPQPTKTAKPTTTCHHTKAECPHCGHDGDAQPGAKCVHSHEECPHCGGGGPHGGHLKNGLGALGFAIAKAKTATSSFIAAQDQAIAGQTVAKHADTDAAACAIKCKNHPQCRGFNVDDHGACHLKSATRTVPAPGKVAHLKPQDQCHYDMSAHYTPNAQAYHQDKCVARVMEQMSDPVGCTAYMAGIAEGNPDLAGCTVHDLTQICHDYTTEFKQQDAELLCSAMNQGATRFWRQYGQRKAQGQAQAGQGAPSHAVNLGGCHEDEE